MKDRAVTLDAADEPLAVAATQSTVAARYRLPRGLLKLSSTGGRWKTKMLRMSTVSPHGVIDRTVVLRYPGAEAGHFR